MITKLLEFSVQARGMVVLTMVVLAGLGGYLYARMPVDAFPDISPVMVPVFAEAHGMAPEEVERLITYPIETAMNGLPGVTQIKSTSAFGMAVIYVYFKDTVDIYFARQLVSERLTSTLPKLPPLHEPPTLGPISSGLGQIFIYYLILEGDVDTGGKDPNTYLRELNDWVVKFQLQTVPGVTDILSVGGHVLQYQIRVNPYALQKYDLTLEGLRAAVRRNNRNAGGQFLVLGSEELLVRGIGLLEGLEDIQNIPVKVAEGVPIRIGDVAEVGFGNEIRRGVVTRNGEEEVVSGIVLKLLGENSSEVIKRLYEKVRDVQASLPEGVTLVPYYEQAELVEQATWTVKKALALGALLVALTLVIFLGNLRCAFIVALSLPFCAFIAIVGMKVFDISANLMSLGGIAIGIGMLADGAIVMVENIFRHLSTIQTPKSRKEGVILEAAKEVSRPIVFSIFIIISVFLPLFYLEGVEGKMFSPLAFTICFALFGSLLSALIVAPVLSSFFLKQEEGKEIMLMRKLKTIYRPVVTWAVKRKGAVIVIALSALILSFSVFPFIGTEFIPTLEEGSLLVGVTMVPSVSLEKATETVMKLEREIMGYGEVKETVSRIGRPEAGSHPHPVNYAEIHLALRPLKEWTGFRDKGELVKTLSERLSSYPGVQLNFTQPVQNAFDELLSGIRAQVAIKLFGEDLDTLKKTAEKIGAVLKGIPGLVDLSVEQSSGQPQVQIIADRGACSRFGVTVDRILELVELAIGGEVVDTLYLNTRRFGIHMRYQEPYRLSPEAIENILVRTNTGSLIPLSQVAEVKLATGPLQINREKNQRRWIVKGNVRGRDLGSVISEIQERIHDKVVLPSGYWIEYGGQFENQQRAMTRLSIIVPVVIGMVFVMLWMAFGKVRQALIIIINVPLALVGGILGLLLTGEYISVPASVGFIALFGIAVQNGVVLVSYINRLRENGTPLGASIIEGSVLRLRPVLMTAATTILGLLPLLLSRGIGSEVQRPLAVVVVFGLTTSTLLTLFVVPSVYGWIEGFSERKGNRKNGLTRK